MKPRDSKVSVVNFFPFFTFEMKPTEASSSTNLSNIKNDLIIFCPSMIEPSAYRACVRGSSVPTSQLHWFMSQRMCNPSIKSGGRCFCLAPLWIHFFPSMEPPCWWCNDASNREHWQWAVCERGKFGQAYARTPQKHRLFRRFRSNCVSSMANTFVTETKKQNKQFHKNRNLQSMFFSLLCPQQLLACYRFARMFNWKCLKCWLKCWRAVLVSIWVGALTRVPCRYRWNKKSHSKIPKHGSKSKLSIRKRQAVKRIKDLKDIKQAVAWGKPRRQEPIGRIYQEILNTAGWKWLKLWTWKRENWLQANLSACQTAKGNHSTIIWRWGPFKFADIETSWVEISAATIAGLRAMMREELSTTALKDFEANMTSTY